MCRGKRGALRLYASHGCAFFYLGLPFAFCPQIQGSASIHPSPGLVFALSSDRSAEMRNKRNSSFSPLGGSSAPPTALPQVTPGAADRFLSQDWLSGVVLGTPPAYSQGSPCGHSKNLVDSPHRKSVSPLVVLLACVRTHHHTTSPHLRLTPLAPTVLLVSLPNCDLRSPPEL